MTLTTGIDCDVTSFRVRCEWISLLDHKLTNEKVFSSRVIFYVNATVEYSQQAYFAERATGIAVKVRRTVKTSDFIVCQVNRLYSLHWYLYEKSLSYMSSRIHLTLSLGYFLSVAR